MRCDGLVAEVQDWAASLEEVHARIAGAFVRAEPRARVLAYLRGLLGQLERKNGWTLAEAAGEVSPDGMQRLLRTADWNADAVRDELRSYVVERLGSGGVLIVDETGSSRRVPARPGGPAVHRHQRQDRQLPDRRVLRLRHAGRPGADRPGAVSAAQLDRRPRARLGRRHQRRRRVRDQARAGPPDAHPGPGGRRAGGLADRR